MTRAYGQVGFPKRLMSYLVTYTLYATGSIRKKGALFAHPNMNGSGMIVIFPALQKGVQYTDGSLKLAYTYY